MFSYKTDLFYRTDGFSGIFNLFVVTWIPREKEREGSKIIGKVVNFAQRPRGARRLNFFSPAATSLVIGLVFSSRRSPTILLFHRFAAVLPRESSLGRSPSSCYAVARKPETVMQTQR